MSQAAICTHDASVKTDPARRGRFYQPTVDILEDAHEYRIVADLPGVKASDVDVKYQDGTLTLTARAPARQGENVRYLVREYGVADFHRQFEVGEGVDAEKISAHHADGVLTLTLPKAEAAKPRRINVEVK